MPDASFGEFAEANNNSCKGKCAPIRTPIGNLGEAHGGYLHFHHTVCESILCLHQRGPRETYQQGARQIVPFLQSGKQLRQVISGYMLLPIAGLSERKRTAGSKTGTRPSARPGIRQSLSAALKEVGATDYTVAGVLAWTTEGRWMPCLRGATMPEQYDARGSGGWGDHHLGVPAMPGRT